MKVQAIQNISYRPYITQPKKNMSQKDYNYNDIGLQNNFYYPTNISFGLAQSKKLRMLFDKGLPCMYTGVEMLGPSKIKSLLKHNILNSYSANIFKLLKRYEPDLIASLNPIEKEVYYLIKSQSKSEPDKKVSELIQDVLPKYKKQLENEQEPIFKTLMSYSYSLPEKQAKRFNKFMEITRHKINGVPVNEPFSVTQFKYKVSKIRDDIEKMNDAKSLKIMNHIVLLSEYFAPQTDKNNIKSQRRILNTMEVIQKHTVLSKNDKLRELIEISQDRLNQQKVLIPFSRKAFIYDLSQVLDDLPDQNLKNIFIKVAEKLPTSKNNVYAYITKASSESSEKIMYRLLTSIIASVEHIKPKSCGGQDRMCNYGGATIRINSDRSNIPFTEQMQKMPDTAKNCQKYLDRLIKYAHDGVFEEIELDVAYIENFKRTIETESKGAIVLDTSALYKDGRFPKPKSAEEIVKS